MYGFDWTVLIDFDFLYESLKYLLQDLFIVNIKFDEAGYLLAL